MTPMDRLMEGYRQFRSDAFASQVASYRRLAAGQRPETMIIGCCDSRVDPATIFAAGPGELFVARNVANLVPPFTDDMFHHGTSAALEFAVTGLKVKQIVVMGHGECGGIQACMDAAKGRPTSYFVGPWVEIAAPARDAVLQSRAGASEADQRRNLEYAAVRLSLENLKTFPFVTKAVEAGDLALEGAWFSIGEGALYWLDKESGEFRLVPAEGD
jgi:carbonic anhydrase